MTNALRTATALTNERIFRPNRALWTLTARMAELVSGVSHAA
ncbi:MAG TPA: hypothetical protein VEL77_14980 [Rugosimonospora sp.]|nr:hypothetical protein [Rugosimonospora sp.]